jgi:hypothetical protein
VIEDRETQIAQLRREWTRALTQVGSGVVGGFASLVFGAFVLFHVIGTPSTAESVWKRPHCASFAPGPAKSPAPVESARGTLRWDEHDRHLWLKTEGGRVVGRVDSRSKVVASAKRVFMVIEDAEDGIALSAFDADALLALDERALTRSDPVLFGGAPLWKSFIRSDTPPGRHEIDFPDILATIPEGLVPMESTHPALSARRRQTGFGACCLLVIDPAHDSIRVIPERWWNDTPCSPGFWPSRVARTPDGRVLVEGDELPPAVLTDDLSDIACWADRR